MRIFRISLLIGAPLLAVTTGSLVSAQETLASPTASGRTEVTQDAPASVEDVVQEGISFGFDVHRFQDDFGMSLRVGTPTFAHGSVRITGGGGIAWYPYASNGSGEQTWLPYYHGRLNISRLGWNR